jgi:8-oxo-dGTP diphosphatase
LATSLESAARFCERCGTALVKRAIEDRLRPCCLGCGFVAYPDPKIAAGIILAPNNEIILLKRNIEPGLGKWVFPGGYVDAGEPPEEAAVREVWEEVGLVAEIDDLLGVFSIEGHPVVLVVYTGHVTGGTLKVNFESQAVETFDPSRIPWEELAFATTTEALKTYLARGARS